MTDRKAPEAPPSSETWNQVPWKKLEQHVFRIQKRIYRASQRGNERAVQKLQKLLMKSEAARLLAVRKVTQDNQNKQTAGVDGVKTVPPKQRFALVQQIHPAHQKHHTPHSVRRIYLHQSGEAGKQRVGIPVMQDRAHQVLVQLALEPQWEARFEPNSYGWRPGRSCHDAIMAIFCDIRFQGKFVLQVHLKDCLKRIPQSTLLRKLKTFPAMQRVIKTWLNAGIVDSTMCASSTEAAQLTTTSSLLINVVLDGMEACFQPFFKKKRELPHFVRYADEVVVFHNTLEGVQKAKSALEAWLCDMGLELKLDAMQITHTLNPHEGRVGFDFLGWTVRQFPAGERHTGRSPRGKPLGFKTIIRPSKQSVQDHRRVIKNLITRHQASKQEVLIRDLNSTIGVWTNYYKTMVAAEEFSQCDHLMWWQLWRWAKRRHPAKGEGWRRARYWSTVDDRQWVFKTPDGSQLRLHSQTKIQRQPKVKGNASPYEGDFSYWSQRLRYDPLLRTDKEILLRKQQGKCRGCGLHFRDGDILEVDHIHPRHLGGSNTLNNKCLLHRHCHDAKHAKRSCVTGINHK